MSGRCQGNLGDAREVRGLEVHGLPDLDRVEAKEALQKVVVHLGDEGVP